MPGSLQDLNKGQTRNIADLMSRLVIDFRRAGYMFQPRNEAWLREESIRAREYIASKEGTRYRGALLIRLHRGEARGEVYLTSNEPAQFRIVVGAHEEFVDQIDRTIILKLRKLVDESIEGFLEGTLRLIR
jgi:hypothetical protein